MSCQGEICLSPSLKLRRKDSVAVSPACSVETPKRAAALMDLAPDTRMEEDQALAEPESARKVTVERESFIFSRTDLGL